MFRFKLDLIDDYEICKKINKKCPPVKCLCQFANSHITCVRGESTPTYLAYLAYMAPIVGGQWVLLYCRVHHSCTVGILAVKLRIAPWVWVWSVIDRCLPLDGGGNMEQTETRLIVNLFKIYVLVIFLLYKQGCCRTHLSNTGLYCPIRCEYTGFCQ